MASPSRLLKAKHGSPLPSQFLPYTTSLSCNNLSDKGEETAEETELKRPMSAVEYREVYNELSGKLQIHSISSSL
jgi:hypothetical protein